MASGTTDGETAPALDLRAELEVRLRQQAAVAAMGQLALAGASFDDLLGEIVSTVRAHLDVDIVGYLHCTDDPASIRAVAGVGWPPGYEHDGRLLPVVEGGMTAVALSGREPLVVYDARTAAPSPILLDAGVRSSILVPIHGARALGLIGVHSRVARRFSRHDAAFLAAAANVVAVAHGRLEAEAALEHRATHDALTGLPNRALLLDRLEAAVTARHAGGGSCALLLVDLDGFKEVNDILGHGVGDVLLREVAARLRDTVAGTGTVARLGGDEFAIVLDHVAGANGARRAAARVRSALDDAPVVDGMPIPVEASIGVAMAPEHGSDTATLLQRADLAMYRAKRHGAGTEVYEDHRDGRQRGKLALAAQLVAAVDAGQLSLHYQPKLSLADGAVVGAEALVRWHHPTQGLLPPDVYLGVVEPTVAIVALSRWVVEEAVAQAVRWRDRGLDLDVAVNCSARYLQAASTATHILDTLTRHDLPPTRLVVELTESAVVTNPALALATVRRLADAGVRVSIDDFGTGFACLAQLERFPVSEIKIDRGFVAGLGDRPSGGGAAGLGAAPTREAIVRGILELGERLGLDVVAEGVETPAALRRLVDFGCRLAQGFLVCPPVPAGDLPAALAARRWSGHLEPVGLG